MTTKALLAVLVCGALGCTRVLVPDRLYLDAGDSLAVKIVHTARSDNEIAEYRKAIEGLQEMNGRLVVMVDSLTTENLGVESRLVLVKALNDSLKDERDSYASKWLLYKNLLDECKLNANRRQ